MNKKSKYAFHGAAWCGLGNALLNVINQLNEKPNHPIDWSRVLKALGKGALVGGTGGFMVGAYVDFQNNIEKPLNTNAILSDLIKDSRLTENDRKYLRLCEKADWLIQQIKKKFDSDLKGEPFRFGSTKDGTALREKYDVDVSVSFKSDAFFSALDMYHILEDFLIGLTGVNGITEVRKQNVSIGIFFNLGFNSTGKVDIVPVKITKSKSDKTSGYMHKNGRSFFASHTYQKTDTTLLSKTNLSKTQKEILIALKKWKRKENIPISSHLLQNLICDSYSCNRNNIPKGITAKIMMVITHMGDYIETLHLTSIENTNNILTNIPDSDKTEIKNACKKLIEDFEYQPNSIIHHFE
jgi:hypothetical protein